MRRIIVASTIAVLFAIGCGEPGPTLQEACADHGGVARQMDGEALCKDYTEMDYEGDGWYPDVEDE